MLGGGPSPHTLHDRAIARGVPLYATYGMTETCSQIATGRRAIGDAATDADALDRIADLADDPPPGTTLVIAGDDDHTRGRYDGAARGLVRELEALGAIRSWGRFELAGDGGWRHRITVPAHRTQSARELVESWLALTMIDAALVPGR